MVLALLRHFGGTVECEVMKGDDELGAKHEFRGSKNFCLRHHWD